MTIRHMLLAVGVIAAAWLAFFGDKTPATAISEPVARATAPATGAGTAKIASDRLSGSANQVKREPVILALEPRNRLIGEPGSSKAAGGLFSSQSWTPPPPPPPPPPKPPPPTAPPLPFTYLGKKIEDNKWEVYLARADQTFIVREQTIIEGSYRVDSIKPPMLTLTYLPLKQGQTLTIGGAE
ncbi:hypothetical protein [Polaromonas sp.]|uniref:hypothetical protein n=1 Tax=Polaromonas sp. TaxID=1869339 RepID=UPI0032643C44